MSEENKPFTKEELLQELITITDPQTGLVRQNDLARLVFNSRFPEELPDNADRKLIAMRNDSMEAKTLLNEIQPKLAEVETLIKSTNLDEIDRKNRLFQELDELEKNLGEVIVRISDRTKE